MCFCVFPLRRGCGLKTTSTFFTKKLENFIIIAYNMNMANVNLLPAPDVDSSTINIQTLKRSLANILADQFRLEFQSIHLSGQLLRSINVSTDEEGNYQVEIPAKIYDVGFYRKYGIIKHTSQDSYAIDVNLTGGFSGMHKDYLAHCLNRAIMAWASTNGITKMDIDISRID